MKPLSQVSVRKLIDEFISALETRGWSGNVSEARKITPPGQDIFVMSFRRDNGRDEGK